MERNHSDILPLAVLRKPGGAFQNNPNLLDHVPEWEWEARRKTEHCHTHARVVLRRPPCRFHSRRSANSISCARQRKDMSHCRSAQQRLRAHRATLPQVLARQKGSAACQQISNGLTGGWKSGRNKTEAHKRVKKKNKTPGASWLQLRQMDPEAAEKHLCVRRWRRHPFKPPSSVREASFISSLAKTGKKTGSENIGGISRV